jgi:nitrite reductase (NADH) small subunit
MSRYVVGRAEDLPPGSLRLIPVGRWGIGIFNVHGQYYALNNYCPHAGGPLCVGDVTGTTSAVAPYKVDWVRQGEIVICPWHGWEFEIATGRTITDPKRSVRTYPVLVEDGMVILEAGADQAGHDELPGERAETGRGGRHDGPDN